MYASQQSSQEHSPTESNSPPTASSTTPNTSLKRHSVLFAVFKSLTSCSRQYSACLENLLGDFYLCSISQQLYKSLPCFVSPPLLLPQELAGLFPFFATNISNSTCETTRGRQKSHGLSYHHPHPCRNVSSCQFCTCLRTVFHIYYKVVSLLGRRGKVKSLFWRVRLHPSLTHTNVPLFLAFLFPLHFQYS